MSKFLVVAIEIGTTTSGLAMSFKFEFARDPYDITHKEWSVADRLHLKVPTCVLIEPDGRTLHCFGYEAEDTYADLAHGGACKDWYFFKSFKQLLFDRLRSESDVFLEDSLGKRLPAKIVYSTAIQYFKDDLIRELNSSFPEFTIEDIQWILTIPDMRSDKAKTFVIKAAEAAGIPRQQLTLVSESEAARVYCIYYAMKRSTTEKDLIILDADESITVYLTEKLNNENPTVLQCSKIDCGSFKVKDAFEDFLGKCVGTTVISKFKAHYQKDFIETLQRFEMITLRDLNRMTVIDIVLPKSLEDLVEELTDNTIQQCIVNSSFRDSFDVRDEKLIITAQGIRSIFNSVVTDISNEIEQLLNSPFMNGCSSVFMIDGFSELFLLTNIHKKFSQLKTITVTLDQPDLAILKGAVIFEHHPLTLGVEKTETNLPFEILQTDRKSIEIYKRALAEGTETIHNIRVIIVGHFGVGKTTLTKRLLGQDVNIDDQESTDGIEVHVKRCKVDLENGIWIVRPKSDEIESVNRRLACILKQKHFEKTLSTNNCEESESVNRRSAFILKQKHFEKTFSTNNGTAKPSPEKDRNEPQTKPKPTFFRIPIRLSSETSSIMEGLTVSKDILLKSASLILRPLASFVFGRGSSSEVNRDYPWEAAFAYEPTIPKTNEKTNGDSKAYFEDLAKNLKDLPLEDNANTADLSIWDFAGQYCFYDTHQVFLSRRTIFLLVTDLSKTPEDIVQDDACYPDSKGKCNWKILDFVEFWLKSIHEFCWHPKSSGSKMAENEHFLERSKPTFGPPVILVGTFADKLNQSDRKLAVDTYFSRLRECLVEKNVHVAASHIIENDFAIDNTSITGESGIDSLKKQILETAKLQSYWGEHVPARWITLENVVLNIKSKGLKVLSIRCLVELNSRLPAPLQSDKEIETFLTFHHDCGNIIYFRNEADLKENIILSPQWLVDAFKCLITAESFCRKFPKFHKKWIDFNSTGLFDKELIGEIWENKEESDFKDHKDLLLNYLERLGLVARQTLHPRHMQQNDDCSLLEEESIKDGNLYLAPCILKNDPPKDLIENATKKKITNKLCFTTTSRFLPTAVFNKLLAACIQIFPLSHHKKQYHIYCGCGVFDVPNAHEMVVFFRDNVIQIWLLKYSTDDKEPNNTTCFEQRQFVTDFLKRHLTTLKICVKCPQDSAYSDYMFDIDDLFKREEVACGCQGNEKHAVATQQLTKYWFASQQSTGEIPCYKMDRKPRGWCIIINIEKCAKLSTRTGTEYDKYRLAKVFSHLHFNVEYRDDLTSIEMMRYLQQFSYIVDHSSFDCFVCCILSHGSLGHVYGSDGKAVPIKDMTSVFKANQCPSLAGKPKLFFMQACQGHERMTGVATAADIEPDAYQEETIPLEADFLIGYSTVPGYVSYRRPDAGSWYIRLLCEVLMEYKDRCHLLEILTEVNRRVAKESAASEGGVHKQIPAPQTTLRKKVYFR